MGDVGFGEFLGVHQLGELATDGAVGHPVGRHDDAGGLALSEVTADRFAGEGGRTEDSENVVAQLKRLPQRIPVPPQNVSQIIAACHRGADLQWPPHRVVAGLAARDVEHGV